MDIEKRLIAVSGEGFGRRMRKVNRLRKKKKETLIDRQQHSDYQGETGVGGGRRE